MSYFENIGTISSQPKVDPVTQIIHQAVPQVVNEAVPQVVNEINKNFPTESTKIEEAVFDGVNPVVRILTSQQFEGNLENAGYDLRSIENTVLPAGKRALIKTDLRMQMPTNMFFKVESRSGLALRGIDAKAGVIDCSYRKFVGVILHNYSDTDFVIESNMKIAQGIFLPVIHPKLIRIKDFSEFDKSERGEKGFGSTEMH